MQHTPFRLLTVLACTTLALAACGGEDDTPAGTAGSDASQSGAGGAAGDGITIGIKIEQPGMGVLKDGQASGMDVEIAKVVAKELGFEESDITWKEAQSAQRETMLDTGQVDMIVATY